MSDISTTAAIGPGSSPILAICTELVFYGDVVSSDYQSAVETAAEVLEAGALRLRAALSLLSGPAAHDLPIELAAALVATSDQLDSALTRLRDTLREEPVQVTCGTSGRGWS